MARKKREVHSLDAHTIKQNIGNIDTDRTKYNFAIRFNDLLIDRQISQETLAEATGITMSSLSTYRNGKAEPRITALEKIASYLNVSVDYLLGLTNVKSRVADIQSAHKYTGLSESALQNLNNYSNAIDKNLDLDILSYLIETGYVQTIIGLLKKSLLTSYEFGLIYDGISEKREKGLIVESNEFEFNKLMIALYREVHEKLSVYCVAQIKEMVAGRLGELKETAVIIKQKMDEILQNLEEKNQSVNEQEVQASFVRKLIKQHEGGQK